MIIGIIGLGDMGRLYAKRFSEAGLIVNACGRREKYEKLKEEFKETKINILTDGIDVSKKSDLIIYSVEAENIYKIVKEYGPFTKKGSIVSGQTSVKTPEVKAFEEFIPKENSIILSHSLHGPSVDTKNQILILINHRSKENEYEKVKEVFKVLESNIIELKNYEEHDKITADTQSLTHLGFECMGTAWKKAGFFPWENPSYIEGIDNIKILLTLRIYSGKPHVYAGLAILNPFAKNQIKEYKNSVKELFELMILEDEKNFRKRILEAKKYLFENIKEKIKLKEKVIEEFGLGKILKEMKKPNSNLSLLAMADSWTRQKINPYNNLICQTPPFMLRLGIVEYLFTDEELLEESIKTALKDKVTLKDDLEFLLASEKWSSLILNEDLEGYKKEFESVRNFFGKERLKEALEKSNSLIKNLTANKDKNLDSVDNK